MNMEFVMEELKKRGITNEEQLNEALKKQKKIDIGVLTMPPKDKKKTIG